MIVKDIIDQDFCQYKKPCMTIVFPYCSFKCDKECGESVCQNSALALSPDIEVDTYVVVKRFLDNEMVNTLCCAGLEPFDSPRDLNRLISLLRFCECEDEIIIYTGYTEEEVAKYFPWIYAYKNIIIKFGRFIPNKPHHIDEVLGVELASDNQYAKRIN